MGILSKLKNRPWWPHFIQFVKFGLVGVSNTLLSLLIYYAILYFNNSLYLLANVVSWVISVLNSFILNNRFVFKQKNHSAKRILLRLLRTYLSYGGSFLLATFLLFLQVEHLGVSAWLAPLINLLITIPLNFVLNKFWAFKN